MIAQVAALGNLADDRGYAAKPSLILWQPGEDAARHEGSIPFSYYGAVCGRYDYALPQIKQKTLPRVDAQYLEKRNEALKL